MARPLPALSANGTDWISPATETKAAARGQAGVPPSDEGLDQRVEPEPSDRVCNKNGCDQQQHQGMISTMPLRL